MLLNNVIALLYEFSVHFSFMILHLFCCYVAFLFAIYIAFHSLYCASHHPFVFGDYRVCIIAGNISPIDVITHVPILCEDAEIPYIYVSSKEVSWIYILLNMLSFMFFHLLPFAASLIFEPVTLYYRACV